jgi:hypothetical protein
LLHTDTARPLLAALLADALDAPLARFASDGPVHAVVTTLGIRADYRRAGRLIRVEREQEVWLFIVLPGHRQTMYVLGSEVKT